MTSSHPPSSAPPLPGDDETASRVAPERWPEAAELLMVGSKEMRREQARRFLDFALANQIDLRAMWARCDRNGRYTAVVLIVPNVGRTAMIFATPAGRSAEIDERAALIDYACRRFDEPDDDLQPVDLVQVLVEPEDRLEQRLFRAAGFELLANLSYLQRALPGPRVPTAPPLPPGVQLAPYDEAQRPHVLEALEASYEQTLDCPGLRGLRRTEDVLRGHQATGRYDPSLWTLMRVDDRPAGVLLLNPSSQGRSLELVYLGLAAHARGRGLGRLLLRDGLRRVRSRAERLVTLAVDDDNAPALQLYQSEGFRRRLRRVAFIRPVGRRADDR